jgi:murein DD-endopeptidase MepM/ murein hydrolase activator NlpD
MSTRIPRPAWAHAVILLLAACGGDGGTVLLEPDPPPPPPDGPALVWPLAGSAAPDADSVHSPFGPRALPSGYDFHAGIDLPAPTGTRVRAVQAGRVVQIRLWNGTSSGAGNAVLLSHDDGLHTGYLHLDQVQVVLDQRLEAGDRVGTVGSTGATYPHLHLGYFENLPGTSSDERYSRNPLELLPSDAERSATSRFVGDTVVVELPLRRMTVRRVILEGAPDPATSTAPRLEVDYYQVVARGQVPRDEQIQSGMALDASRPERGRFELRVRPVDPAFTPERVVLMDFRGDTLHVGVRAGG